MSNYSQTNIPVLPEYDRTGYPYRIAVLHYEHGAAEWYECRLIYGPNAFVYHTAAGCVIVSDGDCREQVYRAETGVWTEAEAMGCMPIVVPGKHRKKFCRIWTDHDILDGNGAVWLAAGQVTDWVWKGLKDWQIGLATGLNWVPFRAARTEEPEIGETEQLYAYNDVLLPALPERMFQSEVQVVICWFPRYSTYRAWAGLGMEYDADTKTLRNATSGYRSYMISSYEADGWSAIWTEQIPFSSPISLSGVVPVWASFHLYTTKGTLFMKGTPPKIVVNTKKEEWGMVEPGLWLLGWELGKRLAQQRCDRG